MEQSKSSVIDTHNEKLSVKSMLHEILQNKILILFIATLAAVLVAISQLFTPLKYSATAVVLIEGGKSSVTSIDDLRQPGDDRVSFLAQVEILKSKRVANNTAQKLTLWDRPSFDPRDKFFTWPWSKKEWKEQELSEYASSSLINRVKIDAQRTSGTIKITIETPDPTLSAMVVNEMAEQFISTDRQLRIETAKVVSASLRDRLGDLRQLLTKSENELQEYRESNGIVSVDGSAEVQGGIELKEITSKLAESTARRIQLESVYRQVRPLAYKDYGNVGAVQRDAGVVAAQERVNEAERRVDGLSRTLGNAHFSVQAAATELATTRRSLEQLRRAVVSSIITDYEAAVASEKRMQVELNDARLAMQSLNKQDLQLAVLKREVDNNRDLYEIFRKRATETEVAVQVQASAARLIDRAEITGSSTARKLASIAALAFGVAASAMIIFVIARMKLARTETT